MRINFIIIFLIIVSRPALSAKNRYFDEDNYYYGGLGPVTKTELNYLFGLSSNAQTQFDSKVTGPASSTAETFALFSGTTGKLIKVAATSSTLTSTNRLGIGTVSPAQGIDVRSVNGNSSSIRMTRISDDANSPNLTFWKSRTAAYPSSSDVIMTINSGSRKEDTDAETSTTSIQSVATENHSASALGKELRFFTTPNTTTTSSQRMTIKNDGVVNIANLTASLPVKTNASKDLVSAAIDLSSATEVTNNLPLSKGGTNKTMTAINGGVVWTDADSMEVISAGTSGQFLRSNGAAAPSWVTTSGSDKVCNYFFGGTSATLASPTECTSGTCVEVVDSCSAGTAPTWATVGRYNNLTFASGTWANSSAIFCECEAHDNTNSVPRTCPFVTETGDQTWSTNASGGLVLNMVGYDNGGGEVTIYARVRCTGTAP